ncbi:MAG: CinA family protein [Leucobacter sp.]
MHDERVKVLARRIGELCADRQFTVAVAESLTGGQIAAALAAVPDSAEWFRGGIVAYHPQVKYDVLSVPRGPVVTLEAASRMAVSTARIMGADFSVAVTGVGGPTPAEGKHPGTVCLATTGAHRVVEAAVFRFDGEPLDVLRQTMEEALGALLGRLDTA